MEKPLKLLKLELEVAKAHTKYVNTNKYIFYNYTDGKEFMDASIAYGIEYIKWLELEIQLREYAELNK
jgi:hypothetical protein